MVKAVDIDYIGKYKDEKAYSYWMSGFVDTVYASKCPTDATLTFLKGRVCPSQRIRHWGSVQSCDCYTRQN